MESLPHFVGSGGVLMHRSTKAAIEAEVPTCRASDAVINCIQPMANGTGGCAPAVAQPYLKKGVRR